MQLFQHLALGFRQVLLDAVEEQGRFVKQTFEGADVLNNDSFRQTPEFRFLFESQLLAGVNDYGYVPDLGFDPFHELEPVHIGQSEV